MIELVALDMAGTTVDEGGAVYRALSAAVSAALGAPVDPALLRRWMGAGKREAVAGLLAGSSVDPDPVFADFGARLAAAYAASPPTALPGVSEAIAALRSSGVRVALTTGFSREVAEDILTRLEWTVGGTVDALVTVDDVAAGRPAPYMVFRAMEATGVHSVSAVATAGDTVLDLRAGRNAGAAVVAGVLTGAQDVVALGREFHTHLLPSVAALPEIVG
ncbi:phosphonatase-like hydrolase [Actinokineospora sp. UTMC 2448]|uniref:phosphonatase-like hydrolase n=1 Tax=Actinokineospora sp. UTMC 2448 TaxID=2268449 RepID=UPI0021643459|nr:phosphonatase-like hydrolase [Actinokineospora sp. UTMC 2448]UVS79647.1 Phosphonoacetaldehyde hydrolase [Actinokineospora sp. UTMC 2448]